MLRSPNKPEPAKAMAQACNLEAPGDADVPSVQAAVDSSRYYDTAVTGDDTDILVLLCCRGDLSSKKLFFARQTKLPEYGIFTN
ncbi:hypothetical protein QYM36_005084 [Artemia franciscana]|uniref:Uncharacterized protein n=1 Tax=Artemia franciscana TaxID=6661 RepID=A0AA88I457_ARTSF|nr:hypothetical protein QYM36_005084 [Artemia franciscana]